MNERRQQADRRRDAAPTQERTLPHNLEAERAVLGAILLRNDALDAVELLQAPDFFRAAHQRIYASMLSIREERRTIDLVTIKEELRRSGDLDEVGGPAYIAALVDGVPRSTNVEFYAAIIIEHARRRAAIYAANKLMGDSYDASDPAESVIGDAAERLAELCGQASATRAYRLNEIVPGGMEAIERARRTGSVVTGTPTGFAALDECTTGMHPADLIIVAARTSIGKTSFALAIARHVASATGPALVHSCEMSKEQLFLRMLSAEARVDGRQLRAASLMTHEWDRVSTAANVIGGLPIFIDDTPGVSCREVMARARALKATEGLALIVVDYLQLMRGHGRFDNRTQEVGTISRGLKGIGKRLGVPVVALSQLNRAPETRKAKRPQISDLRESGDIENDADVVLLLYRDDQAPSVAEIIIGKQRNGPTETITLEFLAYCTRFQNREENVPAA